MRPNNTKYQDEKFAPTGVAHVMKAILSSPQRKRLPAVLFQPKRFKGKRQSVSVSLPSELVAEVDKIATRVGWTRSDVIETLCIAGLDVADREATSPAKPPKDS